jgi:hypothetical protein
MPVERAADVSRLRDDAVGGGIELEIRGSAFDIDFRSVPRPAMIARALGGSRGVLQPASAIRGLAQGRG